MLMCNQCNDIFTTGEKWPDDILESIHQNPSLHEDIPDPFLMCPKKNCTGDLLDIDENMLYIIKTLYDKGYRTDSCCSGHYFYYHTQVHISFHHKEEKLPNYPKGMEVDGPTIRHNIKAIKEGEVQKEIYQVITKLIDWVDALPKNPHNPW